MRHQLISLETFHRKMQCRFGDADPVVQMLKKEIETVCSRSRTASEGFMSDVSILRAPKNGGSIRAELGSPASKFSH